MEYANTSVEFAHRYARFLVLARLVAPAGEGILSSHVEILFFDLCYPFLSVEGNEGRNGTFFC